jgi:hypothetical protein
MLIEEIQNLVMLIPTFHGDIKLDKKGKEKTLLRAFQLTASEEKAMASLRARAVSTKLRRKWASEADFLPLTNSAYRGPDGVQVTLNAPIEEVTKFLAKALKPERKLLQAVKFSDGRVEELHSNLVTREAEKEPKKPKAEEKPKKEEKPAVATTVARPVNGCPMPNFPEADVRASRVLETFLTPDQISDYRSSGCFVTFGADSGHRYLIGSRERPSLLQQKLGGRQLFDLEEKRPICVHDWAVPPAEEMLAIHLCLSLPGHETELLSLPEINEEIALADVDPLYRPVIGRG